MERIATVPSSPRSKFVRSNRTIGETCRIPVRLDDGEDGVCRPVQRLSLSAVPPAEQPVAARRAFADEESVAQAVEHFAKSNFGIHEEHPVGPFRSRAGDTEVRS